ncbi:MAG: ACT domain-containing protein, partial [Desulfovibrio sp.]|nr:ACT domain-containing protein [Desulfovibrio sp.]
LLDHVLADMADAGLDAGFFFLARTGEEISLVCRTGDAPQKTLAREDGWRAFRVKGSMDFALVGVLARLAGALAAQGIPIFAVSTFNTDYVLVKEADFDRALACLAEAGCRTA